ncbi:MAG: GntR family transcriptional regulator [Proteobacteria bacterium]|nr:GntR family transcriptional regulator [Pseudomonadota bacterium]
MKPITPVPGRADQAYQALLDEICDGVLAPGTHLVQEELAARLGVSRQPIQQAMALLRSDGLVEEIGTRGLRVTALDPATMRQHYEIRAALDGLAVRGAALRAAGSAEVARDIDRRGRALVQAGKAAAGGTSLRRMVRCDVDFHRFLYEASGNPLLAQTAEPHWRYLRRVMADVLRHAQPGTAIWKQHAEILAAVVAGNAVRAQALAAGHVDGAADRLAGALQRATAA